MDLSADLDRNQTIILLLSGENYNKGLIDNLRSVEGKSVCYISLNKTFGSFKEVLKKNKVGMDNIIVVDAISKTFKKSPDQSDGVYYVSSPSALTELGITIDEFLRHKFDYIIIDSISNLLTYQKPDSVLKFVSAVVNKIRTSKTKAVLYAVNIDDSQKVMRECSGYVDKVIKYS